MESLRYVILTTLALAAYCNAQNGTIRVTATNSINFLFIDNIQITPLPNYGDWRTIDISDIDTHTRLIAIRANNVLGGCSGLLVGTDEHPLDFTFVSNADWVCSASASNGWQFLGYDDSNWTPAFEVGRNQGVTPGCPWIPISGISNQAYWIWTPAHTDGDMVVSCRGYLPVCDYNPCKNGGTCEQNHANLCRCPVRWSGRYCEDEIDECASNPCQHGGICDLTDTGYSCTCQGGYTGTHCETDVTACGSMPCQNGATCVFLLPDDYQCFCAPGYSGDDCEFEIDECSSDPCDNNATCIDEINGVKCECLPGYTGVLCQNEIDECSSSPCQHSGTCTDELNGYKCECHPGYDGDHCDRPVGECAPNPCMNGGTCTLRGPDESVQCICSIGWYGPRCESNANECASNPCNNGGICIDGDERFDCQCTPEFTGPTCDSVIPNCGSRMTQSRMAPTRNFWAMCEIDRINHPQWEDTPCRDLIVDIPYYNNTETIIRLGGNFGCFPTKFPDEVPNACIDNYNQDAVLTKCLSCTHMGICIKEPPKV